MRQILGENDFGILIHCTNYCVSEIVCSGEILKSATSPLPPGAGLSSIVYSKETSMSSKDQKI